MQGYLLQIAGSKSPERTAKVLKLLWGETLLPLPLPATDFFMWAAGKAKLLKSFEQVQVPAYILGPSGAYHHYDYPFSERYPADYPVLFVDQHTDSRPSRGSIGCASFGSEISRKKRVVYVTAGEPARSDHHPIRKAGEFSPRAYNLDREKLLLLFDGDCIYRDALTGWPPYQRDRGTSLAGAISLIRAVRDEAEISGFSNWGFVSWDELTPWEQRYYSAAFSPERIGALKRRTPIVSAFLVGACLGKDPADGLELLGEAEFSSECEGFDEFFAAKYP